jgi:hypothetical protein
MQNHLYLSYTNIPKNFYILCPGGKKKVKLSLSHEEVLGIWGITPPFLTSLLDVGEWSASHPGRFIPRETAPGTHWIGGSVGHRAGVDAVQ